MKVLIVDDASFMRRVFSDVVKEKGYEVVGEASTGKEAIEQYKVLRPDLVVMDIVMPDATGLEAVKAILSFDPGAKVIIVTAAEDETIQSDAFALGARGLVKKPPDPEDLGSIIDRVAQEAEVESPSARMAAIYTSLVRELLQYIRNYFDPEKEKGVEDAFQSFVEAEDGITMDKALTLRLVGDSTKEMNARLNKMMEAGRTALASSVGPTQADELFREAFKIVYQQTPDEIMEHLEVMFPSWLESEVVRMDKASWEASLDMVKKTYDLSGGHIFIVEEAEPKEAYRIFSTFALTGTPGLVIARSAPKEIKNKFKIGPAELIWLTYNKIPDIETIEPTGPGLMYKRISEFVQQFPKAVIILDGLEYLISQTNFNGAQKLIQAIHDDIMLSEAIVLLPLDVNVLDEKQRHSLCRELKLIRPRPEE